MTPTHKIDNQDHMVIMSQLVPQQGDAVTKPPPQRRKNEGGGSGSRTRKVTEEDCSKLKSTNESIVAEICLLKSEQIKLKEKLCEAEKEIQRLSVGLPSL